MRKERKEREREGRQESRVAGKGGGLRGGWFRIYSVLTSAIS